MTMKDKAFKNIEGKGENAGDQHNYSPFPTTFSALSKTKMSIFSAIKFVVCKCFKFSQNQNFLVW